LTPVEKLFEELPSLTFPEFYERLACNGAEIYQKKIGTHFENGALLRIFSRKNEFIGIGRADEYENGSAVKIVKFL
jgi:tRNA U55 pseudouridine synthase TruB